MTTPEPMHDDKAGFCSNCRRGDHALCASPTCTCPDMRRHRNRPGFAQIDKPSVVAPLRPATKDDGLVWCDPPTTRRGAQPVDFVALAAPCVDRPGDWLRIKVYKAKSGAGTAAKKCRAALGDGWDVHAARIPEGSGLWVRRVKS